METKNAWGELTYNTPTRAIWVNYTALPEGLGHINYSTHGGLYMFILHNIPAVLSTEFMQLSNENYQISTSKQNAFREVLIPKLFLYFL